MRYIGGKRNLLDEITNVINEECPEARSIIDVFAGSGVVSQRLKEEGYKVLSNDLLYFSFVLLRGTMQLNSVPKFKKLEIDNPISYLNKLKLEDTDIDIKDCFIYQNYSPNENCNRMYFQNENALKIDIIRITIERWHKEEKINDDEYYYLIASLLSAVPFVANIAGVYAAYLKHWDVRTYKTLTLEEPVITKSKFKSKAYCGDCNDILQEIKADILYSDSPYNSREYLPNYHILETIARYDYPEIKGITGMRNYDKQKSDFCKKSKVHSAFRKMIEAAKVKYVVISYNNEGLISTVDLSSICKEYAEPGTFKLIEIPYRRYKSKIPNNKDGLMEQIYFFKKKDMSKNKYDKSPFNYIGGKYKLLPQLMNFFPDEINRMVDLFAGGCDVCTNTPAKEKYANDINCYVIEIYKAFQTMSIDELLEQIDSTIEKWGLSKTNKDAFIAFRKHYNETHDPIDLYVLMCYSFNYQFRFNANHEYNNPFGKDRSSFNKTMRQNLIMFHENIKDIHFSSVNFRDYNMDCLSDGDFIYADPPYLITTGSYNDGKRGFEGWNQSDDDALFEMLDDADKKGVKFALSNVFKHKGHENTRLIEWSKKYHVHYINFNYNNSNYQSQDTDKETVEVLITNY